MSRFFAPLITAAPEMLTWFPRPFWSKDCTFTAFAHSFCSGFSSFVAILPM